MAAVTSIADMHDPRKTTEGVNLVVGFRPELWSAVRPAEAPADAISFLHDIVGPDGYTIPATRPLWVTRASVTASERLTRSGDRIWSTHRQLPA